jgi:hypothetical protein
MLVKFAARVRGLFAGDYPENREDEQLHINNRGDQIVAPGLPELTELVRLGDSWQVKTATAFAALTTEPTTTAALSLWNGEPAGMGKCYAIDSVAVWERVVDATQQNQLALFAMLNRPAVAAPTDDTNLTIRSLSGRSYGGTARKVVGLAVADHGWFPAGNTNPNAAAVAGGAWRVHDVPLRGLYLVPPGGLFSLHAAKIAATASQLHAVIRWHEVRLKYAA